MNYYAGIDVSLEESCICVINGNVVREGKVSSEPTALTPDVAHDREANGASVLSSRAH